MSGIVWAGSLNAAPSPILDIQGPELDLQEQNREKQNVSALLEKERSNAKDFLERLSLEDSFVARLALKLPVVAEKVKESVSEIKDQVAEKIKDLEGSLAEVDKIPNLDKLPLTDLTNNPGLMKRARVSFDEKKQTWQAVWKKPAIFHFGMLLHPELKGQIDKGEKLHFKSRGMKLALSKTNKNKLVVEQGNGVSHELNAKRLEGLLKRSIEVDGLELFLDRGGNLVLKAEGDAARELAEKSNRS
ncbi:MAG: hypothetical protein AAF558_10685 [Verrucomicrobiota bacterium]